MRTLALVFLLGVVSCKRPPPPAPAEAQGHEAGAPTVVELTPEGIQNGQVRWQRVAPGSFAPRLRLAGSMTGDPTHIAAIGARVRGRVVGVSVALGDVVKRGQDLIEIDAVEMHEATLNYLTARARDAAARDALARQKQLVDERVGAVQDLRRLESEAVAAAASLHEAREHLEFLGLSDADLARIQGRGAATSRVRSPIDGRVVALNVSVGQALTGDENVVTIADVTEVWAMLRVYERDLADVRVGAPVDIQVPTYGDRTFAGTVSFVSDVLDPASRSADVRVTLANEDGALRPGMSATGWVTRQTAPSGLWLPAEAVQPHEGGRIVFVHTGDRHFEARHVVVGGEQGGRVPITQGIGPEDEVVVHGAFALRAELERSSLEE